MTQFPTINGYLQIWFGEEDAVRHPIQRKVADDRISQLVARQHVELNREERRAQVHQVIRLASEIMNVVPSVVGRFGRFQATHPWIGQYERDFRSTGIFQVAESLLYSYVKESSPRANV